MSIFAHAQIESTKAKIRKSKYDQDGLEIEFDVREDDEQGLKEIQIVDLFVAAGYFRARIKGLSSFDKIVGGMVWCISLSNFEIDVDLLFQENSSIGMKIFITEKIVGLLPSMQCPHRLEPHQIQGLDYIHIFPVVQWLVRKAIETKNELGNAIRSFSVYNFSKEYSLISDVSALSTNAVVLEISSSQSLFRPRRKYRSSRHSLPHDHTCRRIMMTLLEYGYSLGTTSITNNLSNTIHYSGSRILNSLDKQTPNFNSSNILEDLMQDLSEIIDDNSSLCKSTLGSLVSLQANSISKYSQEYQTLSEDRPIIQSQTNLRLVASLQKQYDMHQKSLDSLSSIFDAAKSVLSNERKSLDLSILDGSALLTSLEDIHKMEIDVENTLLFRVTDQLSLHEQLKKQEKQFRQHCHDEINRLSSVINSLRTHGKQGTDTFSVEIQKIHEQRQFDQQKYIKVKNLLAKKTREISTLQRRIDDIPSRAELAQYQRRFVELHKLVSATLTETRQYFTLYNTLNDTQIFLHKELQLLNILYEKFDTAMTSQSNKNIYLKHLVQFLDETQVNLARLENMKNTKKEMKDVLNDNYVLLLDQQRQYSKLVRDFGTQIRRNEELHTALS